MLDLIYLLIAFVSSSVTAFILLPWVLKHSYSRGLNTQKVQSKEGSKRILRLGGTIFAPSILIGLTLSIVLMNEGKDLNQSIKTSTMLLGCGFMMIYLIGLLDDIFGLSARLKLVIQVLASFSFPLCNLYFSNLQGFLGIEACTWYIGVFLTVLFVVFVVNAVNMIDGIEGLASVFVILCLFCFGYCFWDSGNLIYSYISGAMIGAISVFLYYNMFGSVEKSTKTYMGDCGSMLLGFSLAYLSVKYIVSEDTGNLDASERILLCMTLLFVPCIDLCRVVIARLLNGENPLNPDKRHIQYQFIAAGIYGRMTLLSVICLFLGIIIINLTLALLECEITWIFLVDILVYTIFMLVVNRRISLYKCSMVLRDNLQDRFYANASTAKKICILTPRFPIPENGGDVLRINNIARQLKREGYKLVLVSFEEDGAPHIFDAERIYDKVYTVHRNKFNGLWQSILHLLTGRAMQCGYYYSANYAKLLKAVIEREKPDLFIAHLLRMMPYLDNAKLHDRSIIEMTDALSKTYSMSSSSRSRFFLKYIYSVERHLIRRAEQYSMMHFPVNVLVSDIDVRYLKTISPHNSSLVVHTNGVDVLPSIDHNYDPNKIVFVGNMRTLQNQDAVLTFVHEIFPRILAKLPNSKFYIVGDQPPTEILELASENIFVTGFVDDLASTIKDAAVAVAPVRVAAGIQNKVLVAMGCGLPVVLTSLISKAIPELEDDENCIIRDEAATIADSCIRLMRHPKERNAIADAGYVMVRTYYSWEERLRGYASSNSLNVN